jgi:hypothetical protein
MVKVDELLAERCPQPRDSFGQVYCGEPFESERIACSSCLFRKTKFLLFCKQLRRLASVLFAIAPNCRLFRNFDCRAGFE